MLFKERLELPKERLKKVEKGEKKKNRKINKISLVKVADVRYSDS